MQETILQRDLELMEQRLEAAAWESGTGCSAGPGTGKEHVPHRQVQALPATPRVV